MFHIIGPHSHFDHSLCVALQADELEVDLAKAQEENERSKIQANSLREQLAVLLLIFFFVLLINAWRVSAYSYSHLLSHRLCQAQNESRWRTEEKLSLVEESLGQQKSQSKTDLIESEVSIMTCNVNAALTTTLTGGCCKRSKKRTV